jgi:hypothetical protein
LRKNIIKKQTCEKRIKITDSQCFKSKYNRSIQTGKDREKAFRNRVQLPYRYRFSFYPDWINGN